MGIVTRAAPSSAGAVGAPARAVFHGRRPLFALPRPLFALPRPDGAGGWVPAPYAPASRAPARGSAGEAVVPQAGLEPATDGL